MHDAVVVVKVTLLLLLNLLLFNYVRSYIATSYTIIVVLWSI